MICNPDKWFSYHVSIDKPRKRDEKISSASMGQKFETTNLQIDYHSNRDQTKEPVAG
jgi:hypothetical protein